MIPAEVFTNLDSKFLSQKQRFKVMFPAMPIVGQSFMWYDRNCHIVGITWVHVESNKLFDEIQLLVEFNK